MKQILKTFPTPLFKIISFLYPSLCFSCHNTVSEKRKFCDDCIPFFECIEPEGRCQHCFQETSKEKICMGCLQSKNWVVNTSSVWEYRGVIPKFLRELKSGRYPFLVQTAAAFLLIQFNRMNWPIPDLIVPMPKRKIFQSTHSEYELAVAFGRLLKIPVSQAIERKRGDLPRLNGRGKSQKEKIESFYIKEKETIENKTILLIDDMVITGSTLHSMAEVLQDAFPKKIYALTLALKESSI